jgi:hypothetical protein
MVKITSGGTFLLITIFNSATASKWKKEHYCAQQRFILSRNHGFA